MTTTRDIRWLGQLLCWHRRDDWRGGWGTCHAGRCYDIIKITRRYADECGGGCQPGWHFTSHPDSEPGQDFGWPVGPGLGRVLTIAKIMAEVWITTAPDSRRAWDDAPSLLTTMGGGGAGFTSPAGPLVAYPDHTAGRVTVHHPVASGRWPQRGELVAVVRPCFEGTLASWSAWHTTGHLLEPPTSWRGAISAIGPALAGLRGAR